MKCVKLSQRYPYSALNGKGLGEGSKNMKTLVQHSEIVRLSLDVGHGTSDGNHPTILDTLKDLLPDSPPSFSSAVGQNFFFIYFIFFTSMSILNYWTLKTRVLLPLQASRRPSAKTCF